MENFNGQEYINELIKTFNKYEYYTNDNHIKSSLEKLNTIKNNNDLLNCLKELNNQNLLNQFLHKKSYYINNNISTNFEKTFKDLTECLEKNPNDLMTEQTKLSIKTSYFNISKLITVEKSLDNDFVNKSINFAENTFKNISINQTEYSIVFNEIKKIHEAPDYFGRFSKNEKMIELSKVDNELKLTALTHECFHALDYTIFKNLNDKYKDILVSSKEFTSFISETKEYDSELIEDLGIPLEQIKKDKDFQSFFEFCYNFDKIPSSKKISQEDTKEYIKQYLNIDVSECKEESEFTKKVLEIYSNEKDKLHQEILKIIPENTEKIKLLSKEMYSYYHMDYSEKSMYALMSDMVSKLSSEKDDYKCSLNEKCARVFEMNSHPESNEEVYKLLPKNISDKNIYPIGSEREYYVSSLNNELKNLSKLINENNVTSNKENSQTSTDNYDIAKLTKPSVLNNINRIRQSQNTESVHKLKIK